MGIIERFNWNHNDLIEALKLWQEGKFWDRLDCKNIACRKTMQSTVEKSNKSI